MDKIIKKSILDKDGNPAQYRLQTKTAHLDQSKLYRKIAFGDRDRNKPHKIILMVGETGTGKTTLINTMINYMLGVQKENRVWFEITDEKSDRTSVHSQTSIITVYGFYPQDINTDLTIIDTPGYGDTRGTELDKEIAESLLSLSESAEEINEIHAVCLVIKATQNRLSDRQIYIFDAVQALFGSDTAENIVLLFTHSDGMPPKNALMAIKEAKIKCALNNKNQPVVFLFNNCQSDPADEEYEAVQEQSWNLSFKGIAGLFKFFDNNRPKTLKMTRDVLQQRKQLEANIYNIQSRVQTIELKRHELKQTQAALEQHNKNVKMNYWYEVDVVYKEKVDIDQSMAKKATCCTVCEENCHYPGCWWAKDLSWCSVMKNNHCTVCTNKCHYSKHVKEAKIYVTKTKSEKRTREDLMKKYEDELEHGVSLASELQQLEFQEYKLVIEAFHCVDTLGKIALNPDSVLTLLHVDVLIEKMNEYKESEKAEKLEIFKKGAEEKHRALEYMTNSCKSLNINK